MNPVSPTMITRQLVHTTLAELGRPDPGPCQETVLVERGFCVGRRFCFESVEAVWKEAEARIDIYDRDGALLKSLCSRPAECGPEMRRAA